MKKYILILFFLPSILFSQINKDWQHLDPELDSALGVSSYRAYDYLKNRNSSTVVVAILDNGAELTHEDLQGQFWVNSHEVPGNGIDDDKNGYIDDIHGWNFLGNAKRENLKRETTELTRIFARLRLKFSSAGLQLFTKQDSIDYEYYQEIKAKFETEVKNKNKEILVYKYLIDNYIKADSILGVYYAGKKYTVDSLKVLKTDNKLINSARDFILEMQSSQLNDVQMKGIVSNLELDLETRLNPSYNARAEIVGDDPDNLSDSIYGNNMVNAAGPYHGTGVAGIIGALWNNTGVKGIAKNVKLMILRVLPNGDEYDKDVALAIRYAVRNGADIISCSFGKLYTSHPEFVSKAIKEAENAGILIIHAAGNDGKNNDSLPTFPTGYYADGTRAKNWISVGASGPKDNQELVAFFSNYGKKTVDVFAPGMDIKSCVLGNKYDLASGTSIAAPVVAAIAAVLKSYFSHLNAKEIREIIIKSVSHPGSKTVYLPGQQKMLVPFENLSVSGGIVNLYKAVQLAEKEFNP